MFGFLDKETFPWWHPVVKWVMPIGLAVTWGVAGGLMLTGSLSMPAFFGALNALPGYYATLEGFSAIAALGAVSLSIASTVGFLTSFLLRATVLCSVNEAIATNARHRNQELQRAHQVEKNALEERLRVLTENCDQQRRDYEIALTRTDNRLEEITNQYHELRGAQQALGGGKQITVAKKAAANDQTDAPIKKTSKGV